MFQVQSGARVGAEILLIVGMVILYVATRLALASWARLDGTAPRRTRGAQWMPVLATTAAAVLMGQPAVAIGLIFGTSVACLSLVLGLSSYICPLQELPANRRVWPLVLPAAPLVLLIGFRGNFAWIHAVMLMAMGATFLAVWMERPAAAEGAPPLAIETEAAPYQRGPILLAIGLAIIGAWAAVKGAIVTGDNYRMLSAPLLATTVLSPLVMLPALGSATIAAHRGQMGNVITSLCGTVQLNLCALLPAVILIDALGGSLLHLSSSTAMAGVGAVPHTTPFPLITWRVDAVVLVLLAFALIPVAAGRWLPDRLESILLIVVYFTYEMVEMATSARIL